MHPFRKAIIDGVEPGEFKKLFSEEVEFWAPMLTKPLHGRDFAVTLLTNAGHILGKAIYTREVKDIKQTLLFWHGMVDGYTLEAVTVLTDDDDTGLIKQVRVLMRSWPFVTLFVDKMKERLYDLIPEDYWNLQPMDANAKPRVLSPIKLNDLPVADDLALHSPIFSKTLEGKEWVIKGLDAVHKIQAPSSYTSIIASPDMKIEVFDTDIDGNPAEGIWVSKINKYGEVYDLTVYLRPYPAVTVLRNKAKEANDKDPEQRERFESYWVI
ncbi:hypothetical protein D0C36_18415 [Mucilaginibacter conchicola]|uniref:Uncharacterized protein n=1 Tax=Mucilaginibacter conchicola TaxID=2303333 RepID=A0A372NRM7_9SPHI|nr:hypothetical protein [Mucilaginibacter conchicola]RFZ90923.1 hypothetical protein D0C36_18415 [Mucilaginibacter conchicola]